MHQFDPHGYHIQPSGQKSRPQALICRKTQIQGAGSFSSRPLFTPPCSVNIPGQTVMRSKAEKQLRTFVRPFPGLPPLHLVNHNAPDRSGRRSCGNPDQQGRSYDCGCADACSGTDRPPLKAIWSVVFKPAHPQALKIKTTIVSNLSIRTCSPPLMSPQMQILFPSRLVAGVSFGLYAAGAPIPTRFEHRSGSVMRCFK